MYPCPQDLPGLFDFDPVLFPLPCLKHRYTLLLACHLLYHLLHHAILLVLLY